MASSHTCKLPEQGGMLRKSTMSFESLRSATCLKTYQTSAHYGRRGKTFQMLRRTLVALLWCSGASNLLAQSGSGVGFAPDVTLAGNFDLGYRQTQLFEPHHNAVVGQWDTRAEVWLPPSRKKFSWGPYLRVGGIGASETEAWENGWLGGPGVGFQVYPFSTSTLRKPESIVGNILGPLRIFGEYNRLDYWGKDNSWRPHKQIRFGAEYWRARYVNDARKFWWAEIWSGVSWQSANEFAPHYDTGILANEIRAGVRVPEAGLLSAFTPYLSLESSLTDNKAYYWENKLVTGGGIRFAPALGTSAGNSMWLNRFAIYAEYVRVASYYRQSVPPDIPDHDVRVGITFSIGQWYR